MTGLSNEARAEARIDSAPHHRPGGADRRHDAGGAHACSRRMCAGKRRQASRSPKRAMSRARPRDRAAARAGRNPVSRETWVRLERFVDLLRTGRRQRTSSRPPRSPTSGRGTSPIRSSSWRSRPMPGPGSISAPAAAFPASARLRARGSAGRAGASGREQPEEGGLPARGRASLALPAIVHAQRIEDFTASNSTAVRRRYRARARAARKALGYAFPLLKTGTKGLFPKGQDVGAELTEAAKSWKY